ncbi:NUDIX hydrolase [Streptomyces odontomachi]|uniref:NUDIX hydrolase n=1 Tax=Streptomyces odontomachi TaxID=2944940 RepID=UPI0027E35A54|nr:NUDIX hydrolase [Streptomyces sp. ODS25]
MFPHRLKGVGGGTSHARGEQWGSTPSRRAAEPAAATLDPAVSEALPRAGERPTALVKARMLFTDSRGRVLLVRLQPVGERPWGLPGGTVETGSESPRAAAVRETAEELGLDCTPGRLLSVDWVTRPDDRPRVVHVFDGGRLADHRLARIRLDEDELAEWRMCPPGEAEELLTDAGWGQLKESLAALTSGTGPVELVDGVPPGA